MILAKSGAFAHRAIWSAEESVSFPQRLPVINEWMDECFEKHPDCIQRGDGFLPTRLLDVGKTIGSKVRLVNSKDIPSLTLPGKYPKFLALSHCWGKSGPSLVLCSSTMDILSTGVELADLPRTFRDASRVTQMLDIRYLWIDSLCIVQDSSADWQKEAAQMDSVYRKAHLTLAAASSTDSEGGLYIDDNLATMVRTVDVPIVPRGIEKCKLRPQDRPELFESSPLRHRAWILQESILSRRTVYFTKDQLIWECRTKHHLEDGKWKHRDHPAHLKEKKTVLFKSHRTDDSKSDRANQWWSWIWDYTNRQLTNPSDRLPAFAGITKFFAEETELTPFIGLLKEHLLTDLLWIVDQRDKQLVSADAPWETPSWSWISIPYGRVRREQETSWGYLYTSPDGIRRQNERQHECTIASVMSTELVWTASPLTSPILRARVTIRGPIRDLKNHLHLRLPWNIGLRRHLGGRCRAKGHWLPYEESHCPCHVYELPGMDTMILRQKCALTDQHGFSEVHLDRELKPGTPIYGLYISVNNRKPADYELETMLLLTPVGNGANEYRRVGVAQHRHLVLKLRSYIIGKGEMDSHFALPCSAEAKEETIDIV